MSITVKQGSYSNSGLPGSPVVGNGNPSMSIAAALVPLIYSGNLASTSFTNSALCLSSRSLASSFFFLCSSKNSSFPARAYLNMPASSSMACSNSGSGSLKGTNESAMALEKEPKRRDEGIFWVTTAFQEWNVSSSNIRFATP